MDGINTNTIIDGAISAAQQTARYLPEPVASGVDFASSLLSANSSSDELVVTLDPAYQELLNKQMEVQQQMQQMTYMSNIERSKHEIQMAPIRNIRVG